MVLPIMVECQTRSLGKASRLETLPKYGFMMQPKCGAQLQQFQLHCACNRLGASLDVQLGKDVLVVPFHRAQ